MTDKPAFPRPFSRDVDAGIFFDGQEGMTLRDYFAGQALVGFCANPQLSKDFVKLNIGPRENNKWHGETAYKMADAMLEARER